MNGRKILFIDRDGTLIREPSDQQIDAFEKLEFLPGVFRYLSNISKELDFELVMVTNQDGLGTASYPEKTFWPVQEFILKTLDSEGIKFNAVHIDRSFASEGLDTRKPGIGMLKAYFDDTYDLANSYVIGDRLTDILLAKNLGAKGMLFNFQEKIGFSDTQDSIDDLESVIAWTGNTWEGIYTFLKHGSRTAEVIRDTAETKIKIALNLDGTGKSKIKTGLAFFDHMLDQLARHGQIDLNIEVDGDLHVDEHHTIEDTAITLGMAVNQALGAKLGVERYGFCLPMDDCLAQVALDFGGRSWLVWDAQFTREKVGDMPTEMFYHFFKSFSDAARANLNIKAEGTNEHHKIEAIFKGFAKAIKMAVKRDIDRMILPSTKGVL